VGPYLKSSETTTIFTLLPMVIKFNGVQISPTNADGSGEGQYLGHGLFEVACRMSHSCRPNCVWFTSQDGRSKIVRALEPIKAGEMITIFYLDQRLLERPIFLRRQDLQKTKNFVCQCKRRLSDEGDDMRRFHCHLELCNGEHLLKQGSIDDEPELLPCNMCGKLEPDHFKEAILENEKKYYFEKITDLGIPGSNVADTILSLEPPHPHHGVALRLYRVKSELLERMGRIGEAIDSQRMWVNCRMRLHGEHCCDQRTGFGYERLGNLLEKENYMEACEIAYQKAVQALQICRGDSLDPLTMCAMKKLTIVQMQLAAKTPSGTGPMCGLCGIQNPTNKKCTRCKLSFYCNRDHQTVHWKVHKRTCCSGQ
jgi:hypothetical protein